MVDSKPGPSQMRRGATLRLVALTVAAPVVSFCATLPAAPSRHSQAQSPPEWVSYAKPEADGYGEQFIDVANIRIEGATRHAQIKEDLSPRPGRQPARIKEKIVSYTLWRLEVVCPDGWIRPEGAERYFTDGNSRSFGNSLDAENSWDPDGLSVMPPDWMSIVIVGLVCSWKPKVIA
jgi:hypothetical protein